MFITPNTNCTNSVFIYNCKNCDNCRYCCFTENCNNCTQLLYGDCLNNYHGGPVIKYIKNNILENKIKKLYKECNYIFPVDSKGNMDIHYLICDPKFIEGLKKLGVPENILPIY